jgi:hypothetical protein
MIVHRITVECKPGQEDEVASLIANEARRVNWPASFHSWRLYKSFDSNAMFKRFGIRDTVIASFPEVPGFQPRL